MNVREQQSQGNLYNTLEAWTSENLKNQKSKTVLITGANSGIGYFAALSLLKAGANVTIAGRNSEKLDKAASDIDFNNLKLEKPYDPRREYYQSKLANIIFALELGRRAEAKGDGILSVACHPGFTKTNLQRHLDPLVLGKMVFMEAWQGCLPTIVAGTGEDVKQGDYYGPDGPEEMGGFPALGVIDNAALNIDVAAKLWELGQEATGVVFP